jgi:hypothetical protein
MPRPNGTPKTGGRRRGTPNRVTREVREFLAEVLTDPGVQEALRAKLLAGDTSAFFKAARWFMGSPARR